MATERANDLRAFKSFIDEQLANGGADLKLDEALAHWEYENETAEERQGTLEANRQGQADADAGRTIPANQVVAELQKKYGLTTDARTLQSNPEEFAKRLRALVDSQPRRTGPSTMDDSRESIYAGRGE